MLNILCEAQKWTGHYLHTIEHSDSGQVIDICRYKIPFKYFALDIPFGVRCDL